MPDTLDFVPEEPAQAEGIDFVSEEPEVMRGLVKPTPSYFVKPERESFITDPMGGELQLVREPITVPEGLYNAAAKIGGSVISPFGVAGLAAAPIRPLQPVVKGVLAGLGAKNLGEIYGRLSVPQAQPKTVGAAIETLGDIAGAVGMTAAGVPEFRPAIKLVGGGVVEGKLGQTHNEVIADNKLSTKEIDQRGFVDDNGNFNNRAETAAQVPGIETKIEPGQAHATEVAMAQEELIGNLVARQSKILREGGTLSIDPDVVKEIHVAYGKDWRRGLSEYIKAVEAAQEKTPEVVTAAPTGEKKPLLPPAEPGETGELGGGAAHVEEIPETGAGGEKYGVAARIREERANAGQVEPVEPGKGIAAPDSVDRGRELLRGGAKAEDALTAFEQNKRLSSDDMALVRAHGEALAAGARTIEDQKGTDSPEYQAAKKALSDWDKRSKAMQTEWHKTGMAQQGETDIDTGSFTGISRAYEQQTGKELPTEHKPTATKIAKGVKSATDEAATATAKLFDKIKEGPDIETAEKRALAAASRTVRENAIRVADLEKKWDVDRAEHEKRGQAWKVQIDAAKSAEAKTAEAVRKNAILAANLENKARVDQAAYEKKAKVWKVQIDYAKKALEKAQRVVRENAIKAAEAERKAQADPMKRVWDQAKSYIEKGTENFDDVRNKVATDLGMTVDQVTRLMAQTKKTKYLANDVWMKQQKARRLQEQAKRWLTNLEIPGYQKALAMIPRAMFSMKVGFHGSVALGTHAPTVAFQPRFWKTYAENFGRMYKLIGSPEYYEMQVQDLLRRPNYITARRAGLVNDPFHYEEYHIPGAKISEAIPEIAKPIAEKFNRLTGMGNRGYSVLKMLRQDMFDQMWNQLPKTTQIPEVAQALADQINHATGVTKKAAPQGLHTLLFAPRLEASRVAWMVVDPAKALGTVLNWKKATPGEKTFAVNQLKEKLWVAGTGLSLLALNQGMLSLTGSEQRINFDDPMRSDWLKFKTGGQTVAYGNPMITMARMPMRIWAIGASDGGKLRNVVYPDEKAGTAFFDYIRSQMSPFASTITTGVLRSDPTGRPLPTSTQPVPMRLRRQGIEPYTWSEFFTETFSPIPVQEALKDVWGEGFGWGPEQRKAAAKLLFMAGTGARINEDRYIGE